ncbi:MAG: GerW family sporulation protein [Clostridiales bacterium]|nr:GerW family sporulation protein [Candidatus Equinaster intestinalis]
MKENSNRSVADLIEFTADKTLEMTKSGSVISEPVVTQNGSTVFTVNDLSIGFAGGGMDKKARKNEKNPAGAGGKITVKPKAVVVLENGEARVKILNEQPSAITNITEIAKGFLSKKEKK